MRRRGGVEVTTRVQFEADAAQELAEMAEPYLRQSAEVIGASIVQQVPVVRGIARRSYKPTVQESGDEVRLYPGSPMWHWLEYGTASNPPYRPVQRGVEAAGARWESG